MKLEVTLSNFQKRCRACISSHLVTRGIAINFDTIACESKVLSGEGAAFLRSEKIYIGEVELQFFIYVDEAGFFCDGTWNIYEVQDYLGDGNALISRLLQEVNDCTGRPALG